MLTLAVGIWLSGKTTGLPLDAGLDLVSRSEQQHVSAWKEGPDRRGTQSLLLSCFVTLFFAAWTSYHPNVPPAGSGGNTFLARLKWVSVAMFAPEVVLWKAWSQFFGAKRFQRQINKAIAESASKKRNPLAAHFSSNNLRTTGANSTQLKAATWSVAARSHTEAAREGEYLNNRKIIAQEPWTLRQAFFASTGGVAVRTKTFHSTDFTCFTEKGLLILAKCGALPSLPFDQVEDKSKADTFQKIIVCVQGLWFVAQTIARWAQHLPVSLLELHAFIHVFCALAMFGFWWRKGYGMSEGAFSNRHKLASKPVF